MTKKIVNLKLADLDRSHLCQSRVTTDPERLAEYQIAWQTEGTEFPPCIVYQDGEKYYIADGFHRIQSKMLARLDTRQEQRKIECEVRQGTMQDAIAYSLSANVRHGLRPNTADKKRAILLYYSLKPEHCAHSDNKVAQIVGCSHTFVGGWKATAISTPIDITFAETKIPIPLLTQTIDNLKAAKAEGKIVTTRNGKMLEQKEKISSKAPEVPAQEPLQMPLQMPLQESTISSKALAEPTLYIVTTTAAAMPRGTVVEGFESLTDSGNVIIDWEFGGAVVAIEDLIQIPYPIDSKVTDRDLNLEIEQTVTGYSLVASDLKIHSIDNNGYNHVQSAEMLKPYLKKVLEIPEPIPSVPENKIDAVDRPLTPILNISQQFSKLNDAELDELQLALTAEVRRRSSQNQTDLSIS